MSAKAPSANALGGLDPREIRLAGKFLASQGRKGDSLLVHVGPREAKVLKALGGAGTKNPVTGLLEYYGGTEAEGGADEGGPGSTSGEGGASSDAAVGDGHGSSYGGRGDAGETHGAPMGGASGAYNSTSQLAIKDPITSAALKNQGTYVDSSGPLGAFGKYVLGLGWVDPTTMNQKKLAAGQPPPQQPDYGIDAIGLGLGVAGAATGLPLGTAYAGLKALGVIPGGFGQVDLGQWGDVHNVAPGPGGGAGDRGPGHRIFQPQQPGIAPRPTADLQQQLLEFLGS